MSALQNEVEEFIALKLSLPEKISPPDDEQVIQFSFQTPEEQYRAQVITIIDTYFQEQQELPSVSFLLEHYIDDSPENLVQFLEKEVNPRLRNRGIPEYCFKKLRPARLKKESGFEPQFIHACNVVCDQSSTKSFAARMKDLAPFGISEQMWNGWMNIPSYYKYAFNLVEKNFNTVTRLNVDTSLARLIQSGDLGAIKYYNELTNRYRPGVADPNYRSMQFMIVTLLEILVKHVSPQVIEIISDELEDTPVGELLRGG